MSGKLRVFLATWLILLSPIAALSDAPSGKFSAVNTAGFVQENGVRTALGDNHGSVTVDIAHQDDGSLTMTVGGSNMRLFPVTGGLSALDWDAAGTTLMHGVDVQAVLGEKDRSDIPVWGAELAWPGTGLAKMVILPLDDAAYTGFLVSNPAGKTIVRQMEFRQAFGPGNRP